MTKSRRALVVDPEALNLVNELVNLRAALREDLLELERQLHAARALWGIPGDGEDAPGVPSDCSEEGTSAIEN